MTATLTLNIPRHVLLTANQRLHWAEKSRRTRQLRDLAYWAARAQQGRREPFPGRVRCVVDIAYPDARRRDEHNFMPTCKAAIDGLVDAGWMVDDSSVYLVGPDLRKSDRRCDPAYALDLTFQFEPAEVAA